jgi:hypothetical protein
VISIRKIDDHDRFVQDSFDFGNDLLCSSTQHQGTRLGSRALRKEVKTLASNLSLLKGTACSEMALLDIGAGRLNRSPSGLAHTLEVIRRNTTSAENIAIRKEPGIIKLDKENLKSCVW